MGPLLINIIKPSTGTLGKMRKNAAKQDILKFYKVMAMPTLIYDSE